jgi:hypothetical protein
MNLDPADTAELAEALLFIAGWLGRDPDRLSASFRDYVGDPAYSLQDLHTDLARFVFLLGGDDGEELSGTRGTGPSA